MERVKISVNDREWFLRVAKTEEERRQGLQGVTNLGKHEGMLFLFDEVQDVSFTMENTEIPLDIIFVNDEDEVISVYKGEPYQEEPITEEDVFYVIELNQNSGIEEGDEIDIEDDTMKILAPDGSVQGELKGGERIVSRKETKVLIRKAKRAQASQSDKDFKSLGRYIFKVFKKQDSREPEYVDSPNS